jgi:hypothetical protein
MKAINHHKKAITKERMIKAYTADEIRQYFSSRSLDDMSRRYIQYHAKRYEFLLKKISELRSLFIDVQSIKIIDIGPSYFTELLRKCFVDDTISTIGFDSVERRGGHFPLCVDYDKSQHFNFDLNDAQYPEKRIKVPKADIIVMGGVIEYCYASPIMVLKFVRTLMNNGGYFVLETVNAVRLSNRIRMLMGISPYKMIRKNVDTSFHEYTKTELLEIANRSGFNVRSCEYCSYFYRKTLKEKIYDFILKLLPPQFQDAIIIVLTPSTNHLESSIR